MLHLQEINWFVLYTRPKHEKKIAEEISQLKYENYLPIRTVFRRWSDRMKRIQEPMFPNYVFVKFHRNEKSRILATKGVVRLLCDEGIPVPVNENTIARIRRLEALAPEFSFEAFDCVGEKVRVTQGAFAGLEGELLRRPRSHRLVIKLPVLRQAVSVEIPSHCVEKII